MPMLPRHELSVSIAGLTKADDAPWAAGSRAAIDWAAGAGFRFIQLDAAMPGLRPRELDRSARRDLAAILRRAGVGCTGLDLWVPPEHLADPARVQRAHDAMLQAIDLASDLSRLGAWPMTLSVVLPAAPPQDVVLSLADASARHGVPVADHAVARAEPLAGVAVGIDPAVAILAGQDAGMLAARAGAHLASARLSDASMASRIVPGSSGGRLDVLAYTASLAVAGYTRPIVLDLRGLERQDAAARQVLAEW